MIRGMIAAVAVLIAVNCYAAIRVVGEGNAKTFDSAGIPPALKPNFEIMKTKCVRCHSMERIVEAITTGVSPISGQPFDHNAIKAYGMKMMRKSESHMTKKEITATVDLMNYLLDQGGVKH